jgi:hypothetical protein
MDRNEESLSTRDLAPSRDAQGGAAVGSQEGVVTDSETESRHAASPRLEQEPTRPLDDPDQAPMRPLDDPDQTSTSTSETGHDSRGPLPEEDPENLTAQGGTGAAGDARPGPAGDGDSGPLLPTDSATDFQSRWKVIQTQFVDDPRRAVEDADGLVAIIMQQLAESFAQERERLEEQWDRGEDISTEDLRLALQRYRSFFHRLLST